MRFCAFAFWLKIISSSCDSMIFRIPLVLRRVIWAHARMGRLRAQLLDELSDTMTIPRQVNDILADGRHISNEIALEHASALQWRFQNAATFDEMYQILHKMKDCSECRFYIRLILWQYCKICPQMTVTEIANYCMLYEHTFHWRCWRICMHSGMYFIMGLFSGIAFSRTSPPVLCCALVMMSIFACSLYKSTCLNKMEARDFRSPQHCPI